jgi:hypothetical protein
VTASGWYLDLGHDSFLPHPLQFIIHSRELSFVSFSVLITDEAMSAEEQQRVKVAFAEGYLAGSGQKAPGRTMKWLKIIQQLLTIVIFLAIFVSFMGKTEQ